MRPDLVLWLCWTVTGVAGSLLFWAAWGWTYNLGHGDAGPDIYLYLTVGALTALGQWIALRVRGGIPAWSWWFWVGGGAVSGFVPAFSFKVRRH